MPPTYSQLIESVLTDVAKRGREWFSLTWLRQQIRTLARKAKKRLGPLLNKAILRVLTDGEQLEYFSLNRRHLGGRMQRREAQVSSINMLEGGRHAYNRKAKVVLVEAQVTAAKTQNELQRENEFLRSELVKMEAQLVRANSVINMNEVVTGAPAAITVRIKRLIARTKNQRHQISQMYEGEQFMRNLESLNDYYERDIQEREEHEANGTANGERDAEEDGIVYCSGGPSED